MLAQSGFRCKLSKGFKRELSKASYQIGVGNVFALHGNMHCSLGDLKSDCFIASFFEDNFFLKDCIIF
ncbi:hypothetical protein ALT721_2010037 [Alteromonas alvinellae]